MMSKPLHILHLEDNPADAELVQILLEKEMPCRITCVKTHRDFVTVLDTDPADVILSDFSMPQFDGLSALETVRLRRCTAPFIFVSGTIGEEMAVDALKQGATDYVLKDRLTRLPNCVQRAVRESQELAERHHVEKQLRESEERF